MVALRLDKTTNSNVILTHPTISFTNSELGVDDYYDTETRTRRVSFSDTIRNPYKVEQLSRIFNFIISLENSSLADTSNHIQADNSDFNQNLTFALPSGLRPLSSFNFQVIEGAEQEFTQVELLVKNFLDCAKTSGMLSDEDINLLKTIVCVNNGKLTLIDVFTPLLTPQYN